MNIITHCEFKSLIRSLTSEEFNQLESNILAEGIREKIIVWNNTIIDGHNRYAIAQKHNLSFEILNKDFADKTDVIDWIISNQLGRRNVTERQREYLIGVQYRNEKTKEKFRGNQFTKNKVVDDNLSPTKTADKLAKQHNETAREIHRFADLSEGIDAIATIQPELKTEILQGTSDYTKQEIQTFAEIQKQEQRTKELELKRIEAERIKAEEETKKRIEHENFMKDEAEKARKLQEQLEIEREKFEREKAEAEAKQQAEIERRTAENLKRIEAEKQAKKIEGKQIRKEIIDKQKDDIENGLLPELKGLFDVISIDPPWNYGREYDPNGSRVANPYPEMTTEQIKAIELPLMDNAIVFLWTTHKFLPDAFDILKHWNLDYKATLVWNKEKIGMGAWFRMQCEFCLVGIKGKPYWNNTTERDIIIESRREHSRKPDAFFNIVDKITAGRKLEYFSREKRNGWEIFGNDTEKF